MIPVVKNADDIFELADLFQFSAQLFCAYKSGLFDLLKVDRSAAEVANILQWIPWKTEIYLDGMVALGLLTRTNGRYLNSTATSQSLVSDSPTFIGDIVEHERLQWSLWDNISSILANEQAQVHQQDVNLRSNPYALSVFHSAMQQVAHGLLPDLLNLTHWASCKSILDLAGGHGLYLAKLLTHYAHLTGEVWDLGEARLHCEKMIATHDLHRRMVFRERDISQFSSFDDVKFDGVMMNHCLHHFDPKDVQNIFHRISATIQHPGVMVIFEPTLYDDKLLPPSNALFSTYMMVNRKYGQVHPSAWIHKQLELVGFEVIRTDITQFGGGGDTMFVAQKI